MVFRTLQTKFPKQLRQARAYRAPHGSGAKGIPYRAMVGPLASMEDADSHVQYPESCRRLLPCSEEFECAMPECLETVSKPSVKQP